jgi:hypothetical protein
MRTLIIIISLFLTSKCFTQITFQENIITNEANTAWFTDVADIDGDGDNDILSASSGDNKIAWYENLDGQGNFGTQQIISTNAVGALSVNAYDFDGDGDMDVLSASQNDNKIAWYENLDGQGNFGTQQTIIIYNFWAMDAYSSDIDNDGDMDVLSAFWDGMICWFENTDSQGSFGPAQIISTELDAARSIKSKDIDNDGDMDVISASIFDNKIAWFENLDGQGNFGTQQIITTNAENAISVFVSDVDGDGDEDILSASSGDDKIAWYENLNGQGDFGTEQIISNNTIIASSVNVIDIDEDGDIDVLSTSVGDDQITWYENLDGLGNFGTKNIISQNQDNPRQITVSDLNGDGKMDLVCASQLDNKIVYYKNTSTLSIVENDHNFITFYPNPTNDFININSKFIINKVEIYNVLGELLKTTNSKKVNLSGLNQGIYILNIYAENKNYSSFKIIKN